MDREGVRFVFGFDATPNLYEMAEKLPNSAWKRLPRRQKRVVKTKPRRRPANFKEKVVEQREFKNIVLVNEQVAEFEYSPTKCGKTYRVVVVRKDLEEKKGQRTLLRTDRALFYITNDRELSVEDVVYHGRDRCNQENHIEQLKNGVHSFTAPLDNLVSNWAYMVIASLAWSLKAWSALLLPVQGRWRRRHAEEKRRLLRMDFSTFLTAWIQIPAQIVRSGRRTVYRFLSWKPWLSALFRLLDVFRCPLRC